MTEDRSHRDASSTSRPRRSPTSPPSREASSTSGSPGSSVRELAARHAIRPRKRLGQHFLLDPNLCAAIARDAGLGPGSRVVEIGAGTGALTVALARAGAREVLAIEVDPRLLPALAEATAAFPAVEIVEADATAIEWPVVLGDRPWVACGNLPYNVGTTIVLDLLAEAPVDPIVVMVQREVAARLAAGPGEEGYGAVSLRVAQRATARLVRPVPPEVFWPRPAVGSAIVRLDRRPRPLADVDEEILWRVVDVAFGQRRKTMRSAVRRLGFDLADADAVLTAAGIGPTARPEELDVPAFARIAELVPG